jgi:hypothetical protein
VVTDSASRHLVTSGLTGCAEPGAFRCPSSGWRASSEMSRGRRIVAQGPGRAFRRRENAAQGVGRAFRRRENAAQGVGRAFRRRENAAQGVGRASRRRRTVQEGLRETSSGRRMLGAGLTERASRRPSHAAQPEDALQAAEDAGRVTAGPGAWPVRRQVGHLGAASCDGFPAGHRQGKQRHGRRVGRRRRAVRTRATKAQGTSDEKGRAAAHPQPPARPPMSRVAVQVPPRHAPGAHTSVSSGGQSTDVPLQ